MRFERDWLAVLLISLAAVPAVAEGVILTRGRTDQAVARAPERAAARPAAPVVQEVPAVTLERIAAPAAPAVASPAPAPVAAPAAPVAAPAPEPRRVTPAPAVQERPDDTREVAQALQAAYRRGWSGQGERLLDEHPQAYRYDQLQGVATVNCAYDGRRMELSLERERADEDIVVAFPPGSYGVESQGQHRQDLVLLRAPVVVLPKGQRSAHVEAPIACASYSWDSPQMQDSYAMNRFQAGSDMDRLLAYLCSGDAKPEAEAQLAVWTVRNRLTRDQFQERSVTFENGVRIQRQHLTGAAQLLQRSGVNPEAYPFFQHLPASAAPSQDEPQVLPRQQRRPRVPAVLRRTAQLSARVTNAG